METMIGSTTWSKFREHIVSIALVLGVMLSVSYCLSESDWVAQNSDYNNAIALGLLFGSAMAFSRFRGSTAAAYSIALSLATAGEIIGQILQSTFIHGASSGMGSLRFINLRLMTFIARVDGWRIAVARSETIHDVGLFVFLSIVILWNVSAWLMWSVARRKRALEGLLPLGILLAINNHLSDQSTFAMLPFITFGISLVARTSFTYQHADWNARRVDHPDDLGLEWGANSFSIALFISLMAVLSPLIATPEGRKGLSDVFRPVQELTAETAGRLFADVNPPQLDTGYQALTPEVGRIGSPPSQSHETIMWVQISDPAPSPEDSSRDQSPSPQHYWRSSIFTEYTGVGWLAAEIPSSPAPLSVAERMPPGRYILRQRYELAAQPLGSPFAVNMPVTMTVNSEVITLQPDVVLPHIDLFDYEVTSWALDLTAEQLSNSTIDYPSQISSRYLQLPESVPQRVLDLAHRITAGADSPYSKAERIETYLRNSYPYSLEVPSPPEGSDVVDYFLFEAPGGFCSYYASAMTIMLRAVGVPTRLVTGYAMGEYEAARNAYHVIAADAHAWVEVYFTDYGWVGFEPTAARMRFERASGDAERSRAGLRLTTPVSSIYSRRELLMLGVFLISLLLMITGIRWLTRPREASPRAKTENLYREIRRRLARVGYRTSTSTTPHEFIAVFTPALSQKSALFDALTQATNLYVEARFSLRSLSVSEVENVQRLWRHARFQRMSLWLKWTFDAPTRFNQLLSQWMRGNRG
jgi:transglutaminase-like putative cysteine protease